MAVTGEMAAPIPAGWYQQNQQRLAAGGTMTWWMQRKRATGMVTQRSGDRFRAYWTRTANAYT